MINEDGSVTMPAGQYWVGDPCYAVPDDRWMEWLENARMEEHYANGGHMLAAAIDGWPVLGISTAHGDGTYDGSDGYQYPVDAGLLGCVPVQIADVPVSESRPFGMNLRTFTAPFRCEYDPLYGTVHIGNVEIMTDPPPDDEYDYDPGYDDDPPEEYETGEDL